MSKRFEIFCDGACSGNPGPAAIGVVIRQDNKTIQSLGESIGEATNNIAEYKAIIRALEIVAELKPEELIIHTDSELLFNQLRGTFGIKNDQLRILVDQIKQSAKNFKRVEFKKIPREENREADQLAKESIKASQDGHPENSFVLGEESPSSRG